MSVTRAAGLVIFRHVEQSVQFLMLQTSYGEHHWTPPKGHVDPGESDWITALRETKEEAGLSENELEGETPPKLSGVRQCCQYDLPKKDGWLSEKIYKDVSMTLNYNVRGKPKAVIYWLAKLKDPEAKVTLSDEHQDFKWVMLAEAKQISGFDDMNKLLDKFNAKAESMV